MSTESLSIGSFGYPDWAAESYKVFARLQREGTIASEARFLVALPTPLAITNSFIAEEDRSLLEPLVERALLDDMNAIVESIPSERLAFQWDIAWEMVVLEGIAGDPPSVAAVAERLVRISEAVPASVPLCHHYCYGAPYDQHFKEPEDTGLMVQLANAVRGGQARPLERLHMPVPIRRTDEAYFAPMADLELGATRLFLGLVHHEDGVDGGRRRIAAAKRFAPAFGVATECGSGRTPTDPVELLRLHVALGAVAADPPDESIEVPQQPAPLPPPDAARVDERVRAFAEQVPCPECDAGTGEPCTFSGWELDRPHHYRYVEANQAKIREEL